jgi:hypothetical protein
MKKLYVIGLLLFSLQSCGESAQEAQEKVEVKQDQEMEKVSVSELSSLEKRKLPSNTIPKGTLVYAGGWDDADGKHIITLSFNSSTREDREYEFTYESTHLYAHHYLLDTLTNSYKETWKIKEFVNDCEFDLTAEFINNAIQISDENENGTLYTEEVDDSEDPNEPKPTPTETDESMIFEVEEAGAQPTEAQPTALPPTNSAVEPDEEEEEDEFDTILQERISKRGRGRPKGSKNKLTNNNLKMATRSSNDILVNPNFVTPDRIGRNQNEERKEKQKSIDKFFGKK